MKSLAFLISVPIAGVGLSYAHMFFTPCYVLNIRVNPIAYMLPIIMGIGSFLVLAPLPKWLQSQPLSWATKHWNFVIRWAFVLALCLGMIGIFHMLRNQQLDCIAFERQSSNSVDSRAIEKELGTQIYIHQSGTSYKLYFRRSTVEKEARERFVRRLSH